MEVESRSIYQKKTPRILNKLIGAFYIHDDIERAIAITGLTLEEIEAIVGRYPASHQKRPGKLKGRITISHKGIEIKNGNGPDALWTKKNIKQE